MFDIIFICFAALLAGVINAIAGGGSFFTLPALVYVGVPAVSANATSALVVLPGYFSSAIGFKDALAEIALKQKLIILACSVIGGVCGALLLLSTSNEAFKQIVPWLLLFATALFAFSSTIIKQLKLSAVKTSVIWLGVLAICVYGGYFNGGLGIILLAWFSITGMQNINTMNGLKSIISFSLTLMSVLTFIFAGLIHWEYAILMMVFSTLGGYLGAVVSKRINPIYIKRFVIIVGLLMSLYFFIYQ